MVKGTTLSAYVRSLKRDNIPHNITWSIVKRAAPYNPITKICRLCICEKAHILFHPEDATLNQRSEFFSKCWHKDKHLLKNNQKAFLKIYSSTFTFLKICKIRPPKDILIQSLSYLTPFLFVFLYYVIYAIPCFLPQMSKSSNHLQISSQLKRVKKIRN